MSNEATKNEVEELVIENEQTNQNEEILSLLKKNTAINKELLAMVRHINVWVAWQRIFFWVKLLLIVVSLGIGFLYLPPFIQESYQQIIDLMRTNAGLQ